MNVLMKHEIPNNRINLIHDMYTNNCARIKVEGKLTKTVPVKKGIRQWDSPSPLLFNIIINEIIEDIKTLKGYSMGEENISCIC